MLKILKTAVEGDQISGLGRPTTSILISRVLFYTVTIFISTQLVLHKRRKIKIGMKK